MSFVSINAGVPYMASELLLEAGIKHAFTTRLGGVSRDEFSSLNLASGRGDKPELVRRNYELICAELGIRLEKMVFSCQVHEDTVRKTGSADARLDIFAKPKYNADALITNEHGVPLIVFTADCVSILLYAADIQAVAAVHAGWRGTVLDIAGKTAKALCSEYGCRPGSILAAIGPSIGACCFETGPEVPEAVYSLLGTDCEDFVERRRMCDYVDLKGINRYLLIRAGLNPINIDVSDECTMCLPDKYWSHRVTKGMRGAQAAIISLDNIINNYDWNDEPEK